MKRIFWSKGTKCTILNESDSLGQKRKEGK